MRRCSSSPSRSASCWVLRYLDTGAGETAATVSILVKTVLLYTIMVTGAIWEKVVFGRYLFAPAFYWEDVFSMLVLALHTAYLVCLFTGALWASRGACGSRWRPTRPMSINAAQFILKLRAARLQGSVPAPSTTEGLAA